MNNKEKHFYTLFEVVDLVKKVKSLGLDVPENFYNLNRRALQEAANGIGAEWMSNISRSAISHWYGAFAPVAFVHDVAGTYDNDGTQDGFERWNAKYFGFNCVKVYEQYAWYNPKRYLLIYQARHLCWALKKFGWKAWLDAYQQKGDGVI